MRATTFPGVGMMATHASNDPLELLKAGKKHIREGAVEGEKDRADHAALSRIVGDQA
jgi:hypothetical protein